ncbi:MAG: sensor histidine kinase [Candidatus Nanopelagicales bacterium]
MFTWVLVALGVICLIGLAVWTVQQRRRSGEEYRSAHRLLSRLQLVSRQLPAGLDEVALAQQTLEQLSKEIPSQRSVLFISQDEQLVPYALKGTDRSPFPALTLSSVKNLRDGKPITGKGLISDGSQHEALIPLTLGSRLVGVAGLQNDSTPFDSNTLRQAADDAQEAALRIDSGRLFADVRTAATAEERRRLAREIHDGIAQELASVGYGLDVLVADLQGTEEQSLADDIRAEVRRIVTELRLSIFDLRADLQPGVGLGSALTAYVQQAGTAAGLTVHMVIDEAHDRLALAQETELLRITQEAVTNVRRHANADNVWVTCRIDPPFAFLRVADDGTGMDSPRNDSFGLDIMQERANRIGARLNWHPRDGGGTVLEVVLQPPVGDREE